MLRQTDQIVVHISGSRGASRQTQVVSARFNGAGEEIGDNGQVVPGRPRLSLPDGVRADPNAPQGAQAPAIPDFNVNEYLRLQQARDLDGLKRMQLDHARAVAAAEANGGGSPEHAIGRAVIEYCKTNFGASERDNVGNDVLVIKPENIDVTPFRAPNDGPMTYTVTGTAVYGG